MSEHSEEYYLEQEGYAAEAEALASIKTIPKPKAHRISTYQTENGTPAIQKMIKITKQLQKRKDLPFKLEFVDLDNSVKDKKGLLQITEDDYAELPMSLIPGNSYLVCMVFIKGIIYNLDGARMGLISEVTDVVDDMDKNASVYNYTKKEYDEIHSTDHSLVSDDKPSVSSNLSSRGLETKPPVGELSSLGSQSLTETTNIVYCCDKPFMKDPKQHSPQCYKNKPQDSYQMMDKKDEEQILAEIKGHMIEEYVYEFMVGGRKVTGVSYAGVKAMVTRRGGYEIISDTIIKEEGYFLAKAKIQDKQMDLQGLGLGECAIHEPFARQKAMGKALRNAYRSIMDEGQFIAFIKQWKEQNK